jgi:thiol-disulfide isomerase/thioredoxin
MALLVLAFAAGCGKQESTAPANPAPAATAAARHAGSPGIAWFDGDVDAAFAAAKAQGKPVLLYWGAVWCPPCQQLKSTVFPRPDFIEKTKLFVPVYLDGDAPGAQQTGERFHVTGYPTMVVLDAERNELQRIAGSMDLAQYASLLDTVLGDVQPVNAILEGAGRSLTAQECHRLAYNGWVLDEVDAKDYGILADRLTEAAQNCPADAAAERMRLKLSAVSYAADAEADALTAGKAPGAALAARVDAIAADLKDRQWAQSAGDALLHLSDNVFAAAKARGARFAQSFAADYSAAMDAMANDARFAEADQLDALASKLSAVKALAPDGKVPEDLARTVRSRLDAALAGEQIPYVRSGIVNSAEHIFDALGDDETAYRVVKAELPKTRTPYYYKADLGSYAENLGRKDEAVDWYAQAYAEAEGVATRFQWGTNYLLSLVRLQPDDAVRIREVGVQVLGELDGPDRIYRRSRARLERIDRELQAWNQAAKGAHADVIGALRERMQQTCTRIPASDPSRQACNSFLTHS